MLKGRISAVLLSPLHLCRSIEKLRSSAYTVSMSDQQPDSIVRSNPLRPWQQRMHEVIFEADSAAGKAFDVALLVAILVSIIAVMLESVAHIRADWGAMLVGIEWVITILFTIEYALQLLCVGRPWRYAVSFFGIVDFLAIAPTYLSIFVVGAQSLVVIRTLRLLRVFRVLKLAHYLHEGQALMIALRRTRAKVTVFLLAVLTVMIIMGSVMYLVEGPEGGFTSIPQGVYWAIVTMTTVGYGDIAPQSFLGQTLAAFAMIIGYSIIVVPSGIFSVEFIAARKQEVSTQACPSCSREGHDADAEYCKYCGTHL